MPGNYFYMPNHAHTHQLNTISHDPVTHVPEQQHQIQPSPPKIPVIILATLGFLLIATGLVWYFNGKSFDFDKEPEQEFAIAPIDVTVLATVGTENIYGEDLKYKTSQSPANLITEELKQQLLDRLIDESIILQAGAAANYIELDATVFNNPLKDQQARQRLITTVSDRVNKEASYKKGAFVSIWFMNVEPGPAGYEAGKQIALEKITPLQQAVANGSMTIKQAGEAIKNDASLVQLDPTSYKANAYYEFDTSVQPRVTFDPKFDEELLSLAAGKTTDVYLAQDHEESDIDLPKKDAVYMFGQVTEVKADGQLPFDAWLEAEKTNYAVTKN